MNKSSKKLLLLALSLIIPFSLALSAVCFATQEELVTSEKKEVVNEFLLGSWISLYDFDKTPMQDQINDFAKSGMNFVDLPRSGAKTTWPSQMPNTQEFWDQFDKFCKNVNTYYLFQGDNMLDYQSSYDLAGNLQNCVGYHLKDEPSAATIPALAEAFMEFYEKDPTRVPFVNLFPNYAGPSNLGGTYRDYVNNWVNSVGASNLEYLYFDHYPFTQTESVRSSYFSDLEVIRDVAYTNGRIKTGGFTQMGSWNGMRRPTVDMARWSCNSLLTYGLKSISHFNWVAPQYVSPENGGEGMLDFVLTSEGEPTDLYEPMQILNWQIRQLGSKLMQMDVKHAFHTSNVPTGAEALPKSFILQPDNKSDDFIYSIAYDKDDSAKYLMVFNKALEGESKNYKINVDLATGIKGLTAYRPTEFKTSTLPDPTDLTTLGSPTEEYINVESGNFTDSFKPGEMKLYKIEGDEVVIFEDLRAPSTSFKSGTYVGAQTINFATGDLGAKIYYTLDGSFPTENNGILYTGPFTVGKDGVTSAETVRAVSFRAGEYSQVVNLDMYITDSSKNVAYGVIGEFKTLDMAESVDFAGFNGASKNIKYLTDNSMHPEQSVLYTPDTLSWAVLDLGKSYSLNKIVVNFWHDWSFSEVKVQVANQADFGDAKTVLSGDVTNVPFAGTAINFEATNARFVRVTDNAQGKGFTVVTEIQAFTAYDSGTDLISDTANWQNLGNGNFSNNGKTITSNFNYDTSNWDRAYGYTKTTYKNFVLDATIKMNVEDPNSWGYVGFGLYRPQSDNVQSNVDKGFIVGIEPKGRALIWNGKKPELGALDASIASWNCTVESSIRIISYNDIISLSVNNSPVMFEKNSTFDRAAGYISFHTGLVPATLSKLCISPITTDDFEFEVKGEAVKSSETQKIAVDRYIIKSKIIEQLGMTAKLTDTNNVEHMVKVDWSCDTYDRTKTGTFKFVGTFNKDDLVKLNLVNTYNIQSIYEVFVKTEVDTSVVENLLNVAAALTPSDFTPESWKYLTVKIEAANAILNDPFMVQSDINVGMFQLYDAIYKYLVSVVDKTDLQKSVADAQSIDRIQYTAASLERLDGAISQAESVLQSNLAGSNEVMNATENIKLALKALENNIDVVNPIEKPDLPTNAPDTKKGCATKFSMLSVISLMSAICAAAFIFKR